MEEKEKEKVIKVSNSNGLSYTGKLTVKLSYGKGKPYKIIEQHNTGTADFFVYILNCIRGTFSPKDRPYYMQLWDKDFTTKVTNTNFAMTWDSSPVVINETSTHEEDKAQVAFNCFMGDTFVAGRSFQGVKIVSFSGVEYARIALEDLVEVTGSNTNIAIDWVINLGNLPMTAEV